MTGEERRTKVSTPGILEALLFAAEEPLSAAALAEIVDLTPAATRDLLEHLRLQYEQSDGALQLLAIAKGYRLVTKPQYAPYIRALKRPRAHRLSRAGLESLAIIAYRQPITGPEIEQLRGVDSSGVLQTLLEHGLIEVAGRRNSPGRPRLYRTTQAFLDQFGLADLSELPELPEGEVVEMTESLFPEATQGQEETASVASAPVTTPPEAAGGETPPSLDRSADGPVETGGATFEDGLLD